VQRKDFVRWGVLADWESPTGYYNTMAPEYEAAQLGAFQSHVGCTPRVVGSCRGVRVSWLAVSV
jgi:hypothetical protein